MLQREIQPIKVSESQLGDDLEGDWQKPYIKVIPVGIALLWDIVEASKKVP